MTILIIIALAYAAWVCYSIRRFFRVCAADRAEMDDLMQWKRDAERELIDKKIAKYEEIVARKK